MTSDATVLDALLACAARGQLTAAEGVQLAAAVGRLREEVKQAARRAGGFTAHADRDRRRSIALQQERDLLLARVAELEGR